MTSSVKIFIAAAVGGLIDALSSDPSHFSWIVVFRGCAIGLASYCIATSERHWVSFITFIGVMTLIAGACSGIQTHLAFIGIGIVFLIAPDLIRYFRKRHI